MGESIEIISAGILVFLIFLGMASPVLIISLIYYFKKRFEHKQIMAAIEKGMSPTDLRPPKRLGPLWIKNLTAGIALLIIAIGLLCLRLTKIHSGWCNYDQSMGYFFVALIFFAVGLGRLIRGILQRKTETAQNSTESPDPPDSAIRTCK